MDTPAISVERTVAEVFIEMLEQGKLTRHYNTPPWLEKEDFDDLTSRYIALNETTLEENETPVRESTPPPDAKLSNRDTEPGIQLEDARRYAETYVEAYEQGHIPPYWPTPAWLGDPGFEDLTARLSVPTMVDSDEESHARSSPTPPEEQSEPEEVPRISTPGPSEEYFDSEHYPRFDTKDDSDDESDTLVGSYRSSSPALSETSENNVNYDEEGENAILADPNTCPALKAMVRSERAKRHIEETEQVDEATFEKNAQELYFEAIARAHPDEELDLDEVWIEVRDRFEEALRGLRVKRMMEAAKCQLFIAIDEYVKEIGISRNVERGSDVMEALKKILKLEKGKEIDWELEEPTVELDEWKDMADLVVWEAAEYCWLLRELDVEIEKEVLKEVREGLEYVRKVLVYVSTRPVEGSGV